METHLDTALYQKKVLKGYLVVDEAENEFDNPAIISKLTIRIFVRNLFRPPLPDSYISILLSNL